MPLAPAAKGIIIVGGVLLAAGIALYENDQVREWVSNSRRKVSAAFQEWADPERQRRRMHTHGPATASSTTFATNKDGDSLTKRRKFQDEADHYDGDEGSSINEKQERQYAASDQSYTRAPLAPSITQESTEGLRRRPAAGWASEAGNAPGFAGSIEDSTATHIYISASDLGAGEDHAQKPTTEDFAMLNAEDPLKHDGYSPANKDSTHQSQDFGDAIESSNDELAFPSHSQASFATANGSPVLSPQLLNTSSPPSISQSGFNTPTSSRADRELDMDMLSDAGTETASHVSRMSEFEEDRSHRDDDVMSVLSSSWSEMDSVAGSET